MSEPAPRGLTSDAFIAWAMEQPGGSRVELVAGEIVARAPERAAHSRLKGAIYAQLAEAIRRTGLTCEAYPDGMAVEVDRETIYEPDALVRCGTPLPDDAVKVTDPVIVVEVLPPSTRARDAGAKLADYFRIPSVRHYLIVRTEDCVIIHHARDDDGSIATRIVRGGPVRLDPPGLELAELAPAR